MATLNIHIDSSLMQDFVKEVDIRRRSQLECSYTLRMQELQEHLAKAREAKNFWLTKKLHAELFNVLTCVISLYDLSSKLINHETVIEDIISALQEEKIVSALAHLMAQEADDADQ